MALGRVNGRASDELDRIRNPLSTTIRDMCETRGLEAPEFRAQPTPLWSSKRKPRGLPIGSISIPHHRSDRTHVGVAL
nr:hypothetical protein [Mycobacterium sp. D16R24]